MSTAKQFLFLIGDDSDGESFDLFVNAPDKAEAIKAWRKYYGLAGNVRPERVILVPVHIKAAGAIAWDDVPQDGPVYRNLAAGIAVQSEESRA